LQFQADILNREVVRPVIQETTALGAAYAAGLAVGFFSGLKSCEPTGRLIAPGRPHFAEVEREQLYKTMEESGYTIV